MDIAALSSPFWWVARQWLRFLTGLMIMAVTLGVAQAALDGPAHARSLDGAGVATVQLVTVRTDGAARPSPESAPSAPSVASAHSVEPAQPGAAPVPARLAARPRPVRSTPPASVDILPVGERAPPAVASVP